MKFHIDIVNYGRLFGNLYREQQYNHNSCITNNAQVPICTVFSASVYAFEHIAGYGMVCTKWASEYHIPWPNDFSVGGDDLLASSISAKVDGQHR